MFSQYSWGDFFKFILLLLIPYYAFVAWKYYREDIIDWFSNRGKSTDSQSSNDSDVKEEPSSPLFTVKNYDDDQPVEVASQSPSQPEPATWLPKVAKEPSVVKVAQKPVSQEAAQDEVELQGPSVAETSEENLNLPVLLQSENPQELSLDVIISAAGQIAPNEDGVLVAADESDESAKRIATVFNQQQGKDAFSDFKFVR